MYPIKFFRWIQKLNFSSLVLLFILILPSISSAGTYTFVYTYRECMKRCQGGNCCDEICSYEACIEENQGGYAGGMKMKDPGAWSGAMAVCYPQIQRIMLCQSYNPNRIESESDSRQSKPKTVTKKISKEPVRDWRSLDDTAFITLLYSSVLDRSPDPAGLKHWIGLLEGGKSRESVMSWFFKSPEYKIRDKNDYGFVRDLYQATHNREPSPTIAFVLNCG